MEKGLKSKNGTVLSEQREVRSRWKDYFRGLLQVDARGVSIERDESVVDDIAEEEIRRK